MRPLRTLSNAGGHRHHAAFAVAAAALLLSAIPAAAALYKWVDANGRVTYSDQPPPANVKAETVSAPTSATNPDAVKEMASQELDLKKRQVQRAEEQKRAAQARIDEANRQQFCVEARSQIRMYDSDLLLRRVNEQGEPVYMDESMKRKEKERLEAIVRDQCGAAPPPRAAAQ